MIYTPRKRLEAIRARLGCVRAKGIGGVVQNGLRIGEEGKMWQAEN